MNLNQDCLLSFPKLTPGAENRLDYSLQRAQLLLLLLISVESWFYCHCSGSFCDYIYQEQTLAQQTGQ